MILRPNPITEQPILYLLSKRQLQNSQTRKSTREGKKNEKQNRELNPTQTSSHIDLDAERYKIDTREKITKLSIHLLTFPTLKPQEHSHSFLRREAKRKEPAGSTKSAAFFPLSPTKD